MNPFELFQSRRCIRSYTGAPGPRRGLEEDLQAAHNPPPPQGEE